MEKMDWVYHTAGVGVPKSVVIIHIDRWYFHFGDFGWIRVNKSIKAKPMNFWTLRS